MNSQSFQNCPRCGWPSAETADGSRHHTGTGTLSYRRCVCGSWLVQLDGRVVGATRPPREPATT